MNNDTRKITEGSMMVAIIGLLLIINRQTAGILEDSVYWILGLPIMVYTAKYGLKNALVPFVCSMLLSVMIAAPTTIFYLFSALVIGVTYGAGVINNWSNKKNLCITILLEMISTFLTVIVLSSIFGYNVVDETKLMTTTLNKFQGFQNTAQLAVMMVTLVYVGSGLLQAIVIHLVGHKILDRLKIASQPLKSISDVEFPKWVGILLVVMFVLYMFQQFGVIPARYANYILMAYVICLLVGMVDGELSILYILRKRGKQNLSFFVVMAVLLPGVNTMIGIFGIYDILTGLRKKLKEEGPKL